MSRLQLTTELKNLVILKILSTFFEQSVWLFYFFSILLFASTMDMKLRNNLEKLKFSIQAQLTKIR